MGKDTETWHTEEYVTLFHIFYIDIAHEKSFEYKEFMYLKNIYVLISKKYYLSELNIESDNPCISQSVSSVNKQVWGNSSLLVNATSWPWAC